MRVPRELLVVMPIFNEEACLEGVLEEWSKELDASGIDYGLLVVDDGSTDRTLVLLENWKQRRGDSRIEVVSRANRGHGQTCLEGYRRAYGSGVPWVFQIDSDGQCDPAYFSAVWAARHDREVVYGRRAVRRDGWTRVLASLLVRGLVRVAARVDCRDANVPYRLMSTARLLPVLDTIPSGFDLANIALAVQLKRAGWREATVPIVFRPRAAGEPSVPLIRFAGKALELFGQLLLLPRPARRVLNPG
jgi:dolichol-phosphate mannosyltransferase